MVKVIVDRVPVGMAPASSPHVVSSGQYEYVPASHEPPPLLYPFSDRNLLLASSSSLGLGGMDSGAGLGLAIDASLSVASHHEHIPTLTPAIGGGALNETGIAVLYAEDDDNFHSNHSITQTRTELEALAEASAQGWGIIMHSEIYEEAEPSILEYTAAKLKIARAVHTPLYYDLKWNFDTSYLAVSKGLSVVACLSDDLNAAVFFSRADKKVTLAFTEPTESQSSSWWDWFWNKPPEVPINTIKRLATEVISKSHAKLDLDLEESPLVEVTGFSKGAIIADVAGAVFLNNGIFCTINTFENPGSLPVIKKFAKQGHFNNIAPESILPDDFREYFSPFMSTTLAGQTYDKHCADTINIFDITFAARRNGEELTIEEFFAATLGKEPTTKDGPSVEDNDNDLPPLVDLSPPSLLEDEVKLIGDDEEEEWYDVELAL
jgi:hypothetical protein